MKILLGILAAAFIASSQAETLTVYTYRHYESDEILFKKFTEKTGIELEVVKSKAGTLIDRIKSEGEKSPADILLTVDAGRLHLAKEAGVLQSLRSETLEARIPAHLRDSEGFWFGFTQRARVIAYAPERVKPEELSTYEALAGPEWKGRVIARSSSNIYNQSLLASIIANTDEKTAIAWAGAVRKNMARPPQGSDRDQMRAVVAGLADAAVVNTYYLGLLANSDSEADRKVASQLAFFFPNQNDRGTHINVSGAGIVATSDNVAGAQKFLEFLASDEAQKVFPATTSEYPAVPWIEWSPLQQSWGAFTADTTALSKVGELNAAAIRCFNLSGWE
ncbi:MAG: Fe(3+) ABC transporter substrate-binding protein [Verrucomicrobiota bacterium]